MRSWRITAWVLVSHQNTANEASNQVIAVRHKRTPLVPMYHVQHQGQMHQAMGSNPGFQPAFQAAPLISSPQKKRRAYIIESDDEDWSLKPISFSEYWGLLEFLGWNLSFLWYAWLSFWHMTSKSFRFAYKIRRKSVSGSAFYLQTGSILNQ